MLALSYRFAAHLLAGVALAGCVSTLVAQDHGHPQGAPETVGQVTFPVSCSAEIASDFERAVAMLHSFWFQAAANAFRGVAEADPACAMAHWGIAMTMMGNPMARAVPSPDMLRQGRASAERARELAASGSSRERMYADAVVAYFQAEEAGFDARMSAHEEAMDALRHAHPGDPEATIFYGRAVVANASPTDLTFARQLAGAELMQPLFEATPRHPGLAHYLIHAYDAPSLADRGVDAAMVYADIAPDAPHALHMPSHIFTRLGYWDESIATNDRSARAEPVPAAAVHPLDYMVYAYLQQGRDQEARAVVEGAAEGSDAFYGALLGYNSAAMPARFALEREAWAEAALLRVPGSGALPFVEAVTRFARAIGAARSGHPDAVESAVIETAALGRLQANLEAAGDSYWATIVRAQRLAAEAWVARARGHNESALVLAAEAAAVEEALEKHPITPGPLLPARELEGDLLMELDRPADALVAYERTLEREPRRARALIGAARAADAAGEAEAATAFYRELLEVMGRADADRPQPAEARRRLGM